MFTKMRAPKIETEIRRDQITEAAFELIGSQGLNGLTMEKIATMVGIVPSALYKHFKNKQQILRAILGLIERRVGEMLDEAKRKGKTPLARLRLLYLAETRLLRQHPEGPTIFFAELSRRGRSSDQMRRSLEFGQTLHEEVSALLRDGQLLGEVRTDMSAETLGYFYLSTVRQFEMVSTLGDGKVDVIRHMDLAWKAFLESVSPR